MKKNRIKKLKRVKKVKIRPKTAKMVQLEKH